MILRRHRTFLDVERDTEAISAQWEGKYRARRLHSRQRLEPALQIGEKPALLVAVVLDLGKAHVERENVLRLQTAVHLSQSPETLDEESSAHQQHHHDRELGHHQHVANAIASRA